MELADALGREFVLGRSDDLAGLVHELPAAVDEPGQRFAGISVEVDLGQGLFTVAITRATTASMSAGREAKWP